MGSGSHSFCWNALLRLFVAAGYARRQAKSHRAPASLTASLPAGLPVRIPTQDILTSQLRAGNDRSLMYDELNDDSEKYDPQTSPSEDEISE